MKSYFSCLLFLIFLMTSCKDETVNRQAENAKDVKKKAVIFDHINKGWNFNAQPTNAVSRSLLNTWTEWRDFHNELAQKPKMTIGAFQKKAKSLSKKIAALTNTIPSPYNKPEIRSRIAVVATKINALNLYINLDAIPEQKVVPLVAEINMELASLQAQLDEIVRKSLIPIEEGESDFIRMQDTARAISSHTNPENLPGIE